MLLCVSPEIQKSLPLGKNSEVWFKKKIIISTCWICFTDRKIMCVFTKNKWFGADGSGEIRDDYKHP